MLCHFNSLYTEVTALFLRNYCVTQASKEEAKNTYVVYWIVCMNIFCIILHKLSALTCLGVVFYSLYISSIHMYVDVSVELLGQSRKEMQFVCNIPTRPHVCRLLVWLVGLSVIISLKLRFLSSHNITFEVFLWCWNTV